MTASLYGVMVLLRHGRVRDRLLGRLRNPVSGRVAGDDRDGDARAGEGDLTGDGHDGRRLLRGGPDLGGDLSGENDSRRGALEVASSHDGYLPFRLGWGFNG